MTQRDIEIGEAIETIIDNFNWERVHNAMTLLDWQWRGGGVPKIPEMKATARTLMEVYFYEGRDGSSSTGGFVARKEGNELSLAFQLANFFVDLED